MPASIKAEVQSVVYHNPDNGYAVARVRAKDEPGVVTIVGCLGQLQPGEFLEIEGEWKTHPKFGRQMEVASFKQTYPATANGVVRFLKSSLKGVGEKTAEALVQEFGVAVLDILDTDPDRLRKVKGVTKKRLEGMVESWRSQREVKSLIVFLHSHDVPPTYAARIFKLFGAQSEEKLRANPYELAYLIRGIGFRTADNMPQVRRMPRMLALKVTQELCRWVFSLACWMRSSKRGKLVGLPAAMDWLNSRMLPRSNTLAMYHWYSMGKW